MKVSIVDAGHFDTQTAYAAINTLRLDDMRPHIYRTHDGGKSWTTITNGIPDGAPVNAVREDPNRRGLLFAGSERAVYVSFDDGEHWQSLRLNMPATSIRDIIVKGDDLIAGTHGRGIWILDDITPLRQMMDDAVQAVRPATAGLKPSTTLDRLFKPQTAYRVRQNTNTDTPIPPDEAAGTNPPDGAIINYALAAAATGPITLDVLDAAGTSVRHYSSGDRNDNPTDATAPVPLYWYRAPQTLSGAAGMHRFLWDIHYQPIPGGGGGRGGLPIAAVPHDTVPAPSGPWAPPGQYTLRLTVDGRSYTQPLTLKMDPRVTTSAIGLTQQFTLSKQLYDGIIEAQKALDEIRARRAGSSGDAAAALQALEGQAGGRGAAADGPDTFNSVIGGMNQLMGLLQGADVAPTTQLVAAVGQRRAALAKLMTRFAALKAEAK